MYKCLFLPLKADEPLPKAGVDDEPNAEPPKLGMDGAPKAGVETKGDEDCAAPKTPVDVAPKIELPVWAPKGLLLPNGLGAKGLLLELFVWPNPEVLPNGLLEDWPKAVTTKVIQLNIPKF